MAFWDSWSPPIDELSALREVWRNDPVPRKTENVTKTCRYMDHALASSRVDTANAVRLTWEL